MILRFYDLRDVFTIMAGKCNGLGITEKPAPPAMSCLAVLQ